MLESSFLTHLQTIFGKLPSNRQTLIFGATISDAMKRLSEIATNEVFIWEASTEYVYTKLINNVPSLVEFLKLTFILGT